MVLTKCKVLGVMAVLCASPFERNGMLKKRKWAGMGRKILKKGLKEVELKEKTAKSQKIAFYRWIYRLQHPEHVNLAYLQQTNAKFESESESMTSKTCKSLSFVVFPSYTQFLQRIDHHIHSRMVQ